jgi:glycyl-tRNA synthetase
MEIEYFTYPETSMDDFEIWLKKVTNFLLNKINLNPENFRPKEIPKDELSHYSKRTVDIYYNYPHGFSELWGIAHRGTHDLSSHIKESGKELFYLEPDGKKIVPEVIEPSVGCDRLFYAICVDKIEIQELADGESREVFHLNYDLAPYKICVLPLSNKLQKEANEIYLSILDKGISATYDESGSIGKRYRRQDAIGTPFCITVDFETANDQKVTIRNRDTMTQERVFITEIFNYIENNKF